MSQLSIQQFAVPLIESLDQYNIMLESHHRRAAIISYHIGTELDLSDEDMFPLVVAALFHDIGALTVSAKENIKRKDNVLAASRHCVMGASILPSCDMFKDVAKIIRNHHINYSQSKNADMCSTLLASHILHLVDRINVLIPDNAYVVNQGERLVASLQKKVGKAFHPDVFDAFKRISVRENLWADMQNLRIGGLFERLALTKTYGFKTEDVIEFCAFVSKIVDYRSSYTLNHSYTVAHVANLLGGYFDVSEEDRNKLMIAGYLHDIGYLCIDPRIIEKKGILTNIETNLIKRHVFYTEKMLRGFKKLKWFSDILTWCERHHERCDGSGYPFSLSAKSLDLGTKILAYADVISALMGKRAHRSGLNIDTTFDILKKDLARTLSLDMFKKIEDHKSEIGELVASCQVRVAQEYNAILSQTS